MVGQVLIQVFFYVGSFYSLQQTYELGLSIKTTLQMRKWRHKSVKHVDQGQTTIKVLESGFTRRLTPEPMPLTMYYNYRVTQDPEWVDSVITDDKEDV